MNSLTYKLKKSRRKEKRRKKRRKLRKKREEKVSEKVIIIVQNGIKRDVIASYIR